MPRLQNSYVSGFKRFYYIVKDQIPQGDILSRIKFSRISRIFIQPQKYLFSKIFATLLKYFKWRVILEILSTKTSI